MILALRFAMRCIGASRCVRAVSICRRIEGDLALKSPSGTAENLPLTSIRGIAALWVAASHYVPSALGTHNRFIDSRFTAIDMFFILSGMTLSTAHARLRWWGVGRFFLKRCLRIYPMCFVALTVLLCVILYPKVNAPWFWNNMNPQLEGSYLLLGAFIDLHTAGNPPSWSAGIEMACYVAFPVALFALRRLPTWGRVAWLAASAIFSWCIWANGIASTIGPGALARGVAGFGAGMAIWAINDEVRMPAAAIVTAEIAGVAGLILAIDQGWSSYFPMFSAILLGGLWWDAGPIAGFLRIGWCVWLGRISFSVYLMHYPLLVAVDKFYPADPGSDWPQIAWFAGIIGAVLALSSFTYLTIERPFLRLGRWGRSLDSGEKSATATDSRRAAAHPAFRETP